jgi:hypothetical protein
MAGSAGKYFVHVVYMFGPCLKHCDTFCWFFIARIFSII